MLECAARTVVIALRRKPTSSMLADRAAPQQRPAFHDGTLLL